MTNGKKKLSVVAILFLAFVMLVASAFTLLGTKDVNAAVDYDNTGVSGAEIRPERGEYKEAIKFIFEIPKESLTEYEGGTATMYFIPTQLLGNAELTNETANAGKWEFGTDWGVNGNNYRFVANQLLPKNAFGVEITAVMCFEKDGNTEYSTAMKRSMSEVARAAYDDEANQADTELLAQARNFLLFYDSKEDNEGEMFTVQYLDINGGASVASETEYLYGDTIKAESEALKEYGYMEDNNTLKTDLTDLQAKTVSGFMDSATVNYTVVKNLGEIVTDGTDSYNPNNVEFTKLVSSGAEGTVYYEDATLKNIPINETNEKKPDTALVTNGTATTGFVTVSAIKKIINEASDLTSLYMSYAQIGEEYNSLENDSNVKLAFLKSKAIKGYYLVANDIAYNKDVHISPFSDNNRSFASIFKGVFDGNGKTIEYDLLNSDAGLFGEISTGSSEDETPTIINAKFVIKDVGSSYNYMLGKTIWAEKHAFPHPLIQNVYVGYDKEFTPTTTDLQIGVFGKSYFTTYKNVIVDMSKVKDIKDLIENDNGATFTYNYGVFDTAYNNNVEGDFTNTIVISEVTNIKHASIVTSWSPMTYAYINTYAKNDNVQNAQHVYSEHLNRFDDYMALKAYFANNPELLDTFNFTDTSMGFPFVGDKAALINSETVVMEGETTVDEIIFTNDVTAEKTLNLSFMGDSFTPTVISSNTSVIGMMGNKVTYDGGFASDITLTVTADIYGVQYQKTLNVKFEGLTALGTIYIDDSEIYTSDLTDANTYTTLNVTATDNTELITNGQKENITLATNEKKTYENAYVYDGEDIKGTATVVVVKKIIDEASDLTSVSLSEKPTGLDYNYNTAPARMREHAIRGYYLVIKDIDYDSNVNIAPFEDTGYDAYSVFQGVFDGNGKTIEYGLSNTTVGLFGEFCGSNEEGVQPVVKNAKFIVKAVNASNYKVMLARRVWSEEGWKNHPLIQNVYFGYDIENFEPQLISSNLRVGVCQTGSAFANYENVIVDMSKVKGISTKLTNGITYGVFDSSSTFASVKAGGTFTNTIVISDVPYIKHRPSGITLTTVCAANEKEEEIANYTYVYENLNRYNDYTALKEYLDANPTVSISFAGIIDAIEFPTVGE